MVFGSVTKGMDVVKKVIDLTMLISCEVICCVYLQACYLHETYRIVSHAAHLSAE